MTNQEAIKVLNCTSLQTFCLCKVAIDGKMLSMKEALGMGIEALENQKTMQVELEGDGYADGELVYDYGKCPKCGWDFEDGDKDWEEPYCCHCGQRLHWFDKQMEGK